MHGRLSQPRRVVIFLLGLAGGLLCSGSPAQAKSDYEIINTGIKGGGCWLDDNNFLVQKHIPRQGLHGFDLEGLYVLDPRHPTDLKPISLDPLEPSAQKRVWQVTCQDGSIIFLVPGSKKGSSRLYRLKVGEAPELIVEMRAPRVSLQGKYVLGNSHRAVMDGGVLQGAFEGNDDCLLADAKAGFKVLCWDWWLVVPEALPQFVFSQYRWEETIKIKGSHGQAKRILNPEPPLRLPDGTEIRLGYILKDLDNRIVMQVKMEQPPYTIYRNTFTINPQGNTLYAACSKVGDHGTRRLTVGGRVCRFPLDGVNQHWTEAAAMQQSPQDPISLQQLNTNERGDIVATELAHRGVTSIWKYTAETHRVETVHHSSSLVGLGGPQLSPSGQWISFSERQILYLARYKEVQP